MSTCGKTFEIVKKRFEELVEIFFEELEEMGTVEEVLQDCGWVKAMGKNKFAISWEPPIIVSDTTEKFNIPCPA